MVRRLVVLLTTLVAVSTAVPGAAAFGGGSVLAGDAPTGPVMCCPTT